MGVRWDDDEFDRKPFVFPPLPPWAYVLMGAVVGFAFCFLTFVPM